MAEKQNSLTVCEGAGLYITYFKKKILLVKSEDCNNCTVVLFIDEVLYIV